MPTDIKMPAFSSTMESGKLIQWLVNEGDQINSGQALAEVETDKAVTEIEATIDGYMGKILIAEPDTDVPVNAVMGIILELNESADAIPARESSVPSPKDTVETSVTKDENNTDTLSNTTVAIKTSPSARYAARSAGIDISLVKGTGPKNRITKSDVLEYIANNNGQVNEAAPQNDTAPQLQHHAVTPMRNAIAKRLLESKRDIPHFYLDIKIVLDKLIELKSDLVRANSETKFSLNIFFIKAAALAMKEVPTINTVWSDDKIIQRNDYNIGIAVAVEAGLVVPVISDVDKKGSLLINKESKELIALAKSGKLPLNRTGNASLTISNLGMYNIDRFNAIINPPESCILALGGAQATPIVEDNNIVVRNVMTCSMSADHRLIDGAVAAHFLNKFKDLLEHPAALLI